MNKNLFFVFALLFGIIKNADFVCAETHRIQHPTIKLNLISTDGMPISNATFDYSVSVEKFGTGGSDGEGFSVGCWHGEVLAKKTLLTDTHGQALVEARDFGQL